MQLKDKIDNLIDRLDSGVWVFVLTLAALCFLVFTLVLLSARENEKFVRACRSLHATPHFVERFRFCIPQENLK